MPREKGLKFFDESSDRKYFTIIPNMIVNGSTAYEQSLYLVMKRIAGEFGTCFASRRQLAKKMGVSVGMVQKTIEKLLKRGWIELIGKKQNKTRPTLEYQIVDLWQENIKHYKNVDNSTNNEKDCSPGELSLGRDCSPGEKRLFTRRLQRRNTFKKNIRRIVDDYKSFVDNFKKEHTI